MKPGFHIIVLLILVILLAAYVGWHLWRITPGGWKWVSISLYVIWMACFFVNFAVMEHLPINVSTVFYEVGNTWPIAFLYLFILFVAADIASACHLLPKIYLKDSAAGFFSIIGLVAATMTIGCIHYHHKYREELTLVTDKPLDVNSATNDITIVMASDLHLGYHNRKAELARWVDIINAEHPDLVLLCGDIIDLSLRPVLNGNYAEEFHRIEAPVAAVLGNHEYFGDIAKAEQFFSDAGITLLKDSVAQFYGMNVVGRNDRMSRRRKSVAKLVSGLEGYTILLDHQPYHLEEAESAGIDFQFSGHTHRGQVWPISWITDIMYEKSWGHHQRGNTRYYITSGLGIWGPKIRIGSRSEYFVLHITGSGEREAKTVYDI